MSPRKHKPDRAKPSASRRISRAKARVANKAMVITDHPEKMSEVLLEFAEPLTQGAESKLDITERLTVAIVAWNLSLVPEHARAQFYSRTEEFASAPAQTRELLIGMMEELVARKIEMFPDSSRFIVDFEVTGDMPDLRLKVVSSVEPPNGEQEE